MNHPNPFDFSDFGPARQPPAPSGPGGHTPGSARQRGDNSSGFDPFANPQGPASPQAQGEAFGPAGPRSVEAFDRPGGGDPALQTAGPPLRWFAVALGLAVVGLIVATAGALLGGSLATALAGWLLAGPVAIGALATYTRVDTQRRTEAIYSAPSWTSRLYWLTLAVCLIGIAVGAWQIALWAGRQ